jgi:hypothetical protein
MDTQAQLKELDAKIAEARWLGFERLYWQRRVAERKAELKGLLRMLPFYTLLVLFILFLEGHITFTP